MPSCPTRICVCVDAKGGQFARLTGLEIADDGDHRVRARVVALVERLQILARDGLDRCRRARWIGAIGVRAVEGLIEMLVDGCPRILRLTLQSDEQPLALAQQTGLRERRRRDQARHKRGRR